jgi:hypothetical protein
MICFSIINFNVTLKLQVCQKDLEIPEAVMTGAKIVQLAALGVATEAAVVNTGVIGGLASKAASESLKSTKEKGFSGWAARKAIKAGDYGSKLHLILEIIVRTNFC